MAIAVDDWDVKNQTKPQKRSSQLFFQSCQDGFFFVLNQAPKVIKLFACSTRLSLKFILLTNVKMPTVVGILTFISMINTKQLRDLKH